MYAFYSFVAGLVFGIGLIVSEMFSPVKVLGFLDLAGNWDPSLALVMAGAIAVGAIAFAVARTRTDPVARHADASAADPGHRWPSGAGEPGVRHRLGACRFLVRVPRWWRWAPAT